MPAETHGAGSPRGGSAPLLLSTWISSTSAVVLSFAGATLLFASDNILPQAIPAFPPAGAWLGQLLGAALLAIAALDWLSRWTLLGGIYGRALVTTNAVLYFISAMVLLRTLTRGSASAGLWVVAIPMGFLAATYCWLLFRGPIERDFQVYRRSQQ